MLNSNNGLSVSEALLKYSDELTPFEKSEMSRYQTIYYVGSVRVRNL